MILASGSPRRERILTSLGAHFRVEVPDVEEVTIEGDLRGSVETNARTKCAWCRERFPDAAVIAADTGIDFDGQAVMKPRTHAEAAAFLRMFSGRSHRVMTAVALGIPGKDIEIRVQISTVTFHPLTDAAIEDYIHTVNPLDRAGAYDIDEQGDRLIASYSGSYSNIMGLPRRAVQPWLAALHLTDVAGGRP